jgi:hypothetical protein
MAYIDVLPLADVKNYIRVDIVEDDADITMMINSAMEYIEKFTGHILYQRNMDYLLINGCARVYDYPINDLVSPTTVTGYLKPGYKFYQNTNTTDETLTLDMGYALASDVPDALLQVAKEMIKVWYFDQDKQIETSLIPNNVMNVLYTYKRHLI